MDDRADDPAINLASAASLCGITARISNGNPAEGLTMFLLDILPTLPEDIRLDSCTVVLEDGFYSSTPDSDEDEPEDEDEDDDNAETASEWADGFTTDLCPSFEDTHIPSDFLTLRLLHPLRWDEQLCKTMDTLRSVGIPLRFEHTTKDGSVLPYAPAPASD